MLNEKLKNYLKRLAKFFDQTSILMPYIGLLIVVFLIIQSRTSSQTAVKTLEESIFRQESLRNTLWTNLLLQRTAVFAQAAILTNDVEQLDRAREIAKSIPNFFSEPETRSTEEKELLRKIRDIELLLRDASDHFQKYKEKGSELKNLSSIIGLVDQVNTLGSSLNARESDAWFSLKENNQQHLEVLKQSQHATLITYFIFIFYLIFLIWILHLKKKADLFLKQSERRMRTLAEASSESILILQNKKIVEVNQAFQNTFGVSADNALGRELSEYVKLPAEILTAEASFDSIFGKETVGQGPNGTPIAIEVSVKPSIFENQPIHIVSIQDLTNKKQNENLRFEKEAAERANRAKSLFLANMSHELRTPMHGVLSFARFGLRDTKGTALEGVASYFQEIFDSGSRLMQLLDDLLDLAKLEAGKMSYAMGSSDFILIFQQLVNEQGAFAKEKNLNLKINHSETKDLIATFDMNRLTQVARNIITNAIKFSNPHTEISLFAKIENQFLICEISNTGKEIPAEELKSIFDKFVQSSKTRSGAGGTGLGLAICKEIIEQHHGEIWADSEPGGKTKFVFKIPLEQPLTTTIDSSVA